MGDRFVTNNSVYHPDYGLPDEVRIRALRDAEEMHINLAAQKNRVAMSTLYKWRKDMKREQA
jgi:transposase-like protein